MAKQRHNPSLCTPHAHTHTHTPFSILFLHSIPCIIQLNRIFLFFSHSDRMETLKMPTPFESETHRHRLLVRHLVTAVFWLSAAFFIGTAFLVTDYKTRIAQWTSIVTAGCQKRSVCETQRRPNGTQTLPKGIITPTTDLQLRPLWGGHDIKDSRKPRNLLAMAVGIKQKESVNKIVKQFSPSDFALMIFHYDGILDQWRDLEWDCHAVHVSAINQTKWWFAKRFLHPDIVSGYDYIFLWDEDLGVDNFHADRYLSIIKEEGLEISQPALDPRKSQVHHHLTKRKHKMRVHSRIIMKVGGKMCDKHSTGPPCTGFVEMMAPVFSKASWRCAWYMIQNDLIQAWGLDFPLGYCAQGDRTKNIGIVDSEYIIHYGLPTLGGSAGKKEALSSNQSGDRSSIRNWSYVELEMFKNRWKKAVKDDDCWTDPYQ